MRDGIEVTPMKSKEYVWEIHHTLKDKKEMWGRRIKLDLYFDFIFQFNFLKLMYILFTKLKSNKLICDLIKIKDYFKSIVHLFSSINFKSSVLLLD